MPGFGARATPEELSKFSDPDTVAGWWSTGFKRAHVGLLTGRGPGRGLVVVDLDMPKDGAQPLTGRWEGCQGGTDVLERLAREAGAQWPDTYTVMTPSGGLHLYFWQPEEGPLIGCANGEGDRPPHLGPMVDVKGLGGYVIAAGSYSSAQGRPYTRISPPGLRPQPLPEWLLELLRPAAPAAPPAPAAAPAPVCLYAPGRGGASKAERYAAAALTGVATEVAAAGPGEYWRTITRATFRLAELQATAPTLLTEQAVTDTLVPMAVRAGMEQREAERAVRTAWARGTRGTLGGAA